MVASQVRVALRHVVLTALAAPLLLLPIDRSAAQSVPSRAPSASVTPGDALLGEWWTENNEGRVRFTRDRDGTYRGTTTCCVPKKPSADHPAVDLHNPNPKQRGRSTVGIVLIWQLSYEDGEYVDGKVYNPRDGKTYRFQAEMVDRNTVKIRGYAGIPLFGQTQVWKRVRASATQKGALRGAHSQTPLAHRNARGCWSHPCREVSVGGLICTMSHVSIVAA